MTVPAVATLKSTTCSRTRGSGACSQSLCAAITETTVIVIERSDTATRRHHSSAADTCQMSGLTTPNAPAASAAAKCR